MEKNIFEGAKFGDKFLTRDGKVAVFDKLFKTSNEYHLYVEDGYDIFCTKHGDYVNEEYPDENYDIVSRYKEPIDEVNLDELSLEDIPNYCYDQDDDFLKNTWIEGFKAGYHKAKEE